MNRYLVSVSVQKELTGKICCNSDKCGHIQISPIIDAGSFGWMMLCNEPDCKFLEKQAFLEKRDGDDYFLRKIIDK